MGGTKPQVELAFAANGAFFDGLLVTAVSAARFASVDCTLVFNILDGGIGKRDFVFLEDRIRHYHPDSIVRRFPVDEAMFADYPAWAGNRMAYARFLLPNLLSDVDYVIYSDVDYLWLRDVAELWSLRNEDIQLQSTIDGSAATAKRESDWFARHGLPFSASEYLCSGFLLINLRLFRKERIVDQLGEFLMRYPDAQFPDQAALNVVLRGRIRFLPQTWQRFTNAVTNEELRHPIALHYANDAPWRVGRWLVGLSDTRLFWYECLAAIRGISMRQAVRQYYGSTPKAIFRRLVFLVSASKVWGGPFRILVRALGRGGYVAYFDTWGRRLDFAHFRRSFK